MSHEAYRGAIQVGLDRFREWLATQGPGYSPPDTPWELPKDCPLWSLGLSAAQAEGILSAVKHEQSTGIPVRA